MKIRNGRSFYGQDIGILVNESTSPRVPGDAGHNGSFVYPVRYQITGTSFGDMVDGSEESRDKVLAAAFKLKEDGCRGIVADCGLMSLYQDEVAVNTGLPFAGASLVLIPTIWVMIGRQGRIGIITGHSGLLKESHLRKSGWDDSIALVIKGMQDKEHFRKIVIEGGVQLDPEKMEAEVVEAAVELKESAPDLKAVILECSNLATYSKAVSDAVDLPVFDTISASNLLQYALCPVNYI